MSWLYPGVSNATTHVFYLAWFWLSQHQTLLDVDYFGQGALFGIFRLVLEVQVGNSCRCVFSPVTNLSTASVSGGLLPSPLSVWGHFQPLAIRLLLKGDQLLAWSLSVETQVLSLLCAWFPCV